MKQLWKVTLSPPSQVPSLKIRADTCEIGDADELYFYDHPSHVANNRYLKTMFAPGQWVLVERIYEEPEESESAANYNAYKELETDD